MAELWTVQKVKDELPDVQLKTKHRGPVVTAHVRGRKNQFATVFVGDFSCEVAWSTLAHCLNTNTPVQC